MLRYSLFWRRRLYADKNSWWLNDLVKISKKARQEEKDNENHQSEKWSKNSSVADIFNKNNGHQVEIELMVMALWELLTYMHDHNILNGIRNFTLFQTIKQSFGQWMSCLYWKFCDNINGRYTYLILYAFVFNWKATRNLSTSKTEITFYICISLRTLWTLHLITRHDSHFIPDEMAADSDCISFFRMACTLSCFLRFSIPPLQSECFLYTTKFTW